MKITKFDRYEGSEFSNACRRALEKVAEEYGVSIELGAWQYGGEQLRMPFTAKVLDANGAIMPDPNFKYFLGLHGLDHTKTSHDGYTLTGYNPRAPKFPWQIKDGNGVGRRATTPWVKARFAKAVAPAAIAAMSTKIGSYDASF